MILFVVPTAATLANRPARPTGAYAHLSTWQLILGEIAHELGRLRTATEQIVRRLTDNRRRPERPHPSVDDRVHVRGLIPARVSV